MSTFIVLVIVALVSSGALFLTLRWLGVIGTAVVAEAEEQRKLPK
jgi:hypothetical protein